MINKRLTIVDIFLFPSIALLAVTGVACLIIVNAALFGFEIPMWVGIWGLRATVLGMSGLMLSLIVGVTRP